MTDVQIALLIVGILIGAILVVIIPKSIVIFKERNGKYSVNGDKRRAFEDEQLNAEPEVITVHAEVIDMECGVKVFGTKLPRTVKYFIIKFKKDDQDILSIDVPEDCYDGFEVGLSGELTLVDGQLNSFVPDN